LRTALVALWLVFAASIATAHDAEEGPPLSYELPAAGSYELPGIERVSDHVLLGSDASPAPLLGLEQGSCAVVSFVYLSCADAAGCPLSLATLQRLDRALARRPELSRRVRLATVSFDPGRDGPEQMARARKRLAPRSDWRFLTAANEAQLRPVLEDFGQDAVPLFTDAGERSGIMRHVVKVFLVDAAGTVRNIYSSGFLDHRILLRDIETLMRVE
jgi:cytochrome oxidase Cu insertion factor (SCO1/SenC/PrrC family)